MTVAKLNDGASFGELALIDNKPRTATIRCLKNCHFIILSRHDYERILGTIVRKLHLDRIAFL